MIARGLADTAALWPGLAEAYDWVFRAAHILGDECAPGDLVRDRLVGLAEAMARTHDRLSLPEHDDVAVDWPAVLIQVDALGDASHRLATLARERMIPCLKSVKAHAQTALDEIAGSLQKAFAAAS
jgi:hypothetical protein